MPPPPPAPVVDGITSVQATVIGTTVAKSLELPRPSRFKPHSLVSFLRRATQAALGDSDESASSTSTPSRCTRPENRSPSKNCRRRRASVRYPTPVRLQQLRQRRHRPFRRKLPAATSLLLPRRSRLRRRSPPLLPHRSQPRPARQKPRSQNGSRCRCRWVEIPEFQSIIKLKIVQITAVLVV